jgi:hypothetical protein
MTYLRVIVIIILGLNAWPRCPWMQLDYGRYDLHNCPALSGTHRIYVALDLGAHQILVSIITLTHIVCSICWPHPLGPNIGHTSTLKHSRGPDMAFACTITCMWATYNLKVTSMHLWIGWISWCQWNFQAQIHNLHGLWMKLYIYVVF